MRSDTSKQLTVADLVELARPDNGPRHGEPLWSEIMPGLWMGGTDDDDCERSYLQEARITKEHFDTVITMYAWANPVDWYVKEMRFGFFDHKHVDINPEDLKQIVLAAYADWQRGQRVLIRCQAGWNRSGLITALVLMLHGFEPEIAVSAIQIRRSPYALNNKSFEAWLSDQGKALVQELKQELTV